MKHIGLSFVALLTLALAAPALASPEEACPADVPAALVPPANQRLHSVLPAVGVQIYMCTATSSGGFAWTFIAPQANLYKQHNEEKLVGTHFIGPVWQSNDGSSVKAARVAGATVDPTAIPWLLLTSVGNVGPGNFAEISMIQRLNTVGGLSPAASACNASTLGTVFQSFYTTDYFMYETHEVSPGETNPQCR